MEDSTAIGRPPHKQRQIRDFLHNAIVRGELAPASRLPTRRELGEQFQASPITVQQALDSLARDGFVESFGRRGTFVAERPPHLDRIVVVFPHTPDTPGWTRFCTALRSEALLRAQQRLDGRHSISIALGVDGRPDGDVFRSLVSDVRDRRLAGIIFATQPSLLANSPLLNEPGIPRVAVMSRECRHANLPSIDLDSYSFINRALDHLGSRGRRKIATLVAFPLRPDLDQHLHAELARRGMRTKAYWHQGAPVSNPQWARQLVHLLMNDRQSDRPDGLIIIDDNLVEHATAGVIAAGARVPEDVDVVAHCNFPWPTQAVIPVKRLGYDVRDVLRACIDAIDRQRDGQPIATSITIPAVFEDEVSTEETER